MSIKCNKETLSFSGVTARLSARSAVECRFPGDIVTVLAVSALPSPTFCRVDSGTVEYRGKVLLTLVYEDGDKNVCRTERGMEFSHRADDENCTPASRAFLSLSAIKISTRREGSGVYVTALIGADITVVADRSIDYVSGGDGFISRTEEASFIRPIFCEGTIEADDEFETEYVGDVLLHSEKINVTSTEAEEGAIMVAGEISFSVCVLKTDGALASYERLIPFRGEIECEGASPSLKADVSCFVESASVSAEADEEKGTCRIRADVNIKSRGVIFSEGKTSLVSDAFSCENNLELAAREETGEYLFSSARFVERASSSAFIGADGGRGITFADSLQAVVLSEASASVNTSDGKDLVEGAVTAKVIVADSDSSHRSVDITLPFSIPVNVEKGRREAEVVPCGVAVRQKKEGEIEAEATLKICVKTYRETTMTYVENISEGDKLPVKTNAFSVYMASAGENLWQTAKRLNKSPEEILRCNPDLSFPLSGNERIIVYRKA